MSSAAPSENCSRRMQRGPGARDERPGHGSMGTSARTMDTVCSGPSAPRGPSPRRSCRLRREPIPRPRRSSARRSSCRRPRRSRRPARARPLRPGCRGRPEVTRGRPVIGLVDPDADPDIRARQRVVALLSFLGRHEVGVPGVADRLGHALDGAVDELPVVELVRADVLLVERVPGLPDQAELRRRRRGRSGRGFGSCPWRRPEASRTDRPRSRR